MSSNASSNIPVFPLNNDQSIPQCGLGTWKSAVGEGKTAVKEAIRIGYRHIDCAAIYGNEAEIGQALKECFEEGICKREDLFVTSKLWNDSHLRQDVIPALKESLARLQLNYLDMYLIHWPVALKKGSILPDRRADAFLPMEQAPISVTWEEMERAVEQGLTKGIGLSNFSAKKIDVLLKTAKITPAILQVEHHPYLQVPKLLSYCKEKGIHITAYSPLGSMDRPAGLKGEDEPILLQDEAIKKIAEKHGVTPAQVLIRWNVQLGLSCVPKSTNPNRLKENLASISVLKLDDDDMEKIKKLDRHRRYLTGLFWCIEGSPHTPETLWDEA